MLTQRLASERAEIIWAEVVQRDADDPAGGDEARPRQVEQPRQELPLGQVACSAHEDDDLRMLRTHFGRYLDQRPCLHASVTRANNPQYQRAPDRKVTSLIQKRALRTDDLDGEPGDGAGCRARRSRGR